MNSFCKCKSYSHLFSKNISIFAIFNDQSFNYTLTNDIVRFEQLGPEFYVFFFFFVLFFCCCLFVLPRLPASCVARTEWFLRTPRNSLEKLYLECFAATRCRMPKTVTTEKKVCNSFRVTANRNGKLNVALSTGDFSTRQPSCKGDEYCCYAWNLQLRLAITGA